MRATTSAKVHVLRASYQANKDFTIEEELILPALVNICREILGETAAKKRALVPLLAGTVSKRTENIAEGQ